MRLKYVTTGPESINVMTISNPKRFSEITHPHSLLDVKDLNKTFAGFQAIDGVNFHLFSGERHAIIGPNGAGKTTFFNLLTGTPSTHVRPSFI